MPPVSILLKNETVERIPSSKLIIRIEHVHTCMELERRSPEHVDVYIYIRMLASRVTN